MKGSGSGGGNLEEAWTETGLGELGPGDQWEKVGGTAKGVREGECEVMWTPTF